MKSISEFVAGILIGMLLGAFLLILSMPAHSETPPMDEHVPIAAVAPAGPQSFADGLVPVMYFGVQACGEYVIWLTYEDGHMARIDKDHHPLDMAKFMKTLEGSKIPGDVVTIACTGAKL